MRLLRSLCAGIVWLAMVSAADAQTPVVHYDKIRDKITINATDTTLKVLAEELSKATGIDARVDGTISDVKISTHIESQPLEKGLKQGFRGYNHVIKYREQGDRHLVTSILILPVGGASTASSLHRTGVVPTERYSEDGTATDNLQGVEDAKRDTTTHRVKYLDDLTPWEQSRLSEEERLALPVSPPVKPIPKKLSNSCTMCTGDAIAVDERRSANAGD